MTKVTLHKIGKKKYQMRWKDGKQNRTRNLPDCTKAEAKKKRKELNRRLQGSYLIPVGPPNLKTILGVMETVVFPLTAPNYEKNIRRDMEILKSYCGDDFNKLTPQDIKAIMADMVGKKNKKKSTVRTWRANCSTALSTAHEYGIISNNPIRQTKNLTLPWHKPPVITDEDEIRLFRVTEDTRNSVRDTLVIAMALYGGMRRQEISGFNIRTDIGTKRHIIARPEKTQQDRTVMLRKKHYDMLVKYATVRLKKYHPYPFYNRNASNVSDRFKQLRAKAKVACSLITLRHTCATRLALKNVTKWALMAYMGHENIKTTQKYYLGIESISVNNIWEEE